MLRPVQHPPLMSQGMLCGVKAISSSTTLWEKMRRHVLERKAVPAARYMLILTPCIFEDRLIWKKLSEMLH